jgi:eukaryotic-like serine/threonine-protein kinase
MAAIYVARAIGVAGFERLFAIKVLHPHLAYEHEFVTMFLDEARLAARIRHPNVISTFEVSDTGDAGYYLVMEYIEGDHLGALMREANKARKRLPASVTLRVVVDALAGLSAAHELTDESGNPLCLVHRDVSPQNIMVGSDGIARLTDFGVAKAASRISNTREGQFKGKLAYMAPEHASDGNADQRSDLFAMGTILWEGLTGQRLFKADNHAATLNKVCLEPIPMPSAVDSDLAVFDSVLEKALERDPEKRFQTATDFIDAIEAKASKLGGIAKPREISNIVREYATEKLQRDNNLIKSAIAAIESNNLILNTESGGMSSITAPAPPPPPLVAVQSQPVLQEMASLDAHPTGEFPVEASLGKPPSSGPGRMVWIMVSIGIAISAGIGLAFALAGSEQPTRITTSPLETKPSGKPAPRPTGSEQKVWGVNDGTQAAQPKPEQQIEKPKQPANVATEQNVETTETEKKSVTGHRPHGGIRKPGEAVSTPPVQYPQKPVAPIEKPVEPPVKQVTPPPTKPTPPPSRQKQPTGDDLIKNPYR